MLRRTLLAIGLSTILLPTLPASAANWVDYKPGVIKNALKAGKTVFVDYSAVWCSTCKTQERRINALRADDKAYDKAMIFVKVDWDMYGSKDVSKSRKIPRRSTLLVLKGSKELGRIVAGTSKGKIKALMDLGI